MWQRRAGPAQTRAPAVTRLTAGSTHLLGNANPGVVGNMAASPVAAAAVAPTAAVVENAMLRMMTNDTATVRGAEVEVRKFLKIPATVPVLLELLGGSANLHVRPTLAVRRWVSASRLLLEIEFFVFYF